MWKYGNAVWRVQTCGVFVEKSQKCHTKTRIDFSLTLTCGVISFCENLERSTNREESFCVKWNGATMTREYWCMAWEIPKQKKSKVQLKLSENVP